MLTYDEARKLSRALAQVRQPMVSDGSGTYWSAKAVLGVINMVLDGAEMTIEKNDDGEEEISVRELAGKR